MSRRLPRLDPGALLPKPLIALDGGVSRIADVAMLVPEHDRELANNSAPPSGRSAANRKSKKVRFLSAHALLPPLSRYSRCAPPRLSISLWPMRISHPIRTLTGPDAVLAIPTDTVMFYIS